MRVLVTGAGGFVGKHLVPHLISAGYEVVTSSRSAESSFPIESIGPDNDWMPALRDVDAVVHLAARAHVLKEESKDPLAEHRRVNTEGTRRLAQQAKQAEVKRFVFVSSIGVLGNNSLRAKNGHSFTDEDDPNPHDDYSRSKWEAEQALADIEGIEKTVIRPSLIYGPGVPGNFRRLLELAKSAKPFPLGAVRNERSLLGLGNLCSFISLCLNHPSAVGKSYVFADNETLSTAFPAQWDPKLGIHVT